MGLNRGTKLENGRKMNDIPYLFSNFVFVFTPKWLLTGLRRAKEMEAKKEASSVEKSGVDVEAGAWHRIIVLMI